VGKRIDRIVLRMTWINGLAGKYNERMTWVNGLIG
jgi:hypothetical protein